MDCLQPKIAHSSKHNQNYPIVVGAGIGVLKTSEDPKHRV